MTGRRRQRRAAQHHLIDHELAIVFAERAGLGLITGIRRIGAARSIATPAEGFVERAVPRRHLPFRFARQMLAGPARECIGFVVADMAHRQRRVDRANPPSVIVYQVPSSLRQ